MAEQMDLVKITFVVSDLDTTFHLQQMTGTEGISQLFRFELTLAAAAEVPFAKVVGKKATLTMKRPGDDDGVFTRRVHGIVGRFQRLERARDGKGCLYRVMLVPEVAPLLQRTDSRIFQDKHMEQVVDEVLSLKKLGYATEKNHLFSRRQPPPARDYCVQYQESDWQFVERLLDEEGYYYFFNHEKSGAALVMTSRSNLPWPISPGSAADEAQGAGATPPRPVVFQPITGQTAERESIYQLSLSSEVCPGQAHLDDYFFQQQTVKVESTRVAKAEGDLKEYIPLDKRLEHYEYPGIHPTQEPGDKSKVADYVSVIKGTTQRRLEQQRTGALQGVGESTCLRFIPGHYFSLFAMDAGDVFDNTDMMLTTVEHHATAGENLGGDRVPGESHCTYHNVFGCLPRRLPFRPPHRPPRPAIPGVQTAVVVGPKNEEIYTDHFGRVKVRFRWDRRAHAKEKKGESIADCSCWIRVAQPWAGKGWGAMFLPRVGHEVLVSFENGDPDRPLITGSVYHAEHPTPYDLPKHKTRSTIKSNSSPDAKGRRSNEIRFEDKKGAEQIYVHAQVNMDEVVGHNHTRTVANKEVITVKKGDRSVHVLKGHQDTFVELTSSDIVKDDRSVVVTEGDETKNIMKGRQRVFIHKNAEKTVKTGNEKTFVNKGSSYLIVKEGMRRVDVKEEHKTTVRKGNKRTNLEQGNLIIDVQEGDGRVKVRKGELTITCGKSCMEMKNDGTIELKGAGGSIEIGASGIKIKAAGGKAVKVEGLSVDLN